MNQAMGYTFIGEDLVITGEVRSGGVIDVRGVIDGKVGAERVVIHPGGRVVGALTAENVEVQGLLQGNVSVRQLLDVGVTGVVRGDVRYGRISMSAGGELSADMRNVPPEIQGDFQIVVRRGRSVIITSADISAYDPDDAAGDLTFTVTNPTDGFVSRSNAPRTPIVAFTQADLVAGSIAFVHDGNGGTQATFHVSVVDKSGTSSGVPKTVQVSVI